MHNPNPPPTHLPAELRIYPFAISSHSATLHQSGTSKWCGAQVRFQTGAVRGRAALSGSLQRLSSELYSNDARFLCELLQNADDASFADTVMPQVVIQYLPQQVSPLVLPEKYHSKLQVTFSSNESGFTEADVQAICR